jgi:hypothetical protein
LPAKGKGGNMQADEMLLVIVIFVSGLILFLINRFRPKIKGYLGEKPIRDKLKDLPQGTYHVLNNVMIPSRNKTTQIDHIIISRFGIFVIETKNYKGVIYGQERDTIWTQFIDTKCKYQFMNPLHQNYGHVMALKELLDEEHIHSIVAFDGGVFGKKMPDNVMQVSEVKSYIRGFRKAVISPVRIKKIVSLLQDSNITDRTSRRNHVKSLKVRKQATARDGSYV